MHKRVEIVKISLYKRVCLQLYPYTRGLMQIDSLYKRIMSAIISVYKRVNAGHIPIQEDYVCNVIYIQEG